MNTINPVYLKKNTEYYSDCLNQLENDYTNYSSISLTDFFYVLPEIWLTCAIVAILLVIAYADWHKKSSFIEKTQIAKKNLSISIWSLYVVILNCVFIFIFYFVNAKYEFIATAAFNSQTILDPYTCFLKILIFLTASIILSSSKNYIENHNRHLMEYPIIVLLAVLFLSVLVSANDLIVSFIAIVGFSLNIYVLILNDAANHNSREAAVKYYYLSAFSSGLIIFGILLAYILFHTTTFIDIAWILQIWKVKNTIINQKELLNIMLIFIIFGFLFKLAAFPCHLWAAAVYEGSPHNITALFILPIKIGVFGFFIKLLGFVFKDIYFLWSFIIWASSITSMIWGCLSALVEKRTKRFIAYSSINQMGFLLIGLAVGTFEGIRASLVYLVIYIIMNIVLFIILLNTQTSSTKRSITYLTDFHYFARNNWFVSSSLVIILFSMAGIPPLAGFFGKYYLFLHAFETQYYSLVIVGLMTSMVSTFYYLKIVKTLWFEKQPLNLVFITSLTPAMTLFLKINEILLLHFFFWSNPFFEMINFILFTGMSGAN